MSRTAVIYSKSAEGGWGGGVTSGTVERSRSEVKLQDAGEESVEKGCTSTTGVACWRRTNTARVLLVVCLYSNVPT